MISIALCDDEQLYLTHYEEKINKLSKKLGILHEVIKFESGESLLFYMEDLPTKFNIIFLDVLMKSINGIDTALKIREINPDVLIVFLTSSESYVYDSFAAQPENYLIKNLHDSKFDSVFTDLIKKVQLSRDYDSFIYQSRNQNLVIPFNKIVYFEVFKRIIIIHTQDGNTEEYYGKLNELEEKLKNKSFVRCHRSFLVNLQYISKINNQTVFLKTKKTLPISRNYYTKTKEILSSYLFGVNINE